MAFIKLIEDNDINDTNPLLLKYPCSISILGVRGSGKTNTLLNILKFYSDPIEEIYIYCSTIEQDGYINLLNEDKRIINVDTEPPDEETLNTIMEIEKNKMIIFDDLFDVVNNKKYEYLNKVYTYGRHKNLSICELSQSIFKVSILKRINSDYIFLHRINDINNVKIFLKKFYDDGERLLKCYLYAIKKNNGHGFLLIDNKTNNDILRFRDNSLDHSFYNYLYNNNNYLII